MCSPLAPAAYCCCCLLLSLLLLLLLGLSSSLLFSQKPRGTTGNPWRSVLRACILPAPSTRGAGTPLPTPLSPTKAPRPSPLLPCAKAGQDAQDHRPEGESDPGQGRPRSRGDCPVRKRGEHVGRAAYVRAPRPLPVVIGPHS